MWLVIALAMYRHWSISEVLDRLDLALPDERAPFVCKRAVAQARQRIDEALLAWLFEQTARSWTTQDVPRWSRVQSSHDQSIKRGSPGTRPRRDATLG